MPESESKSAAIVGAGVVGIACAHYLREAGFRVAVMDQGTVGAACSHGNCGYICPSHVLPLTEPGAIAAAFKSLLNPNAPFRIKPRVSPALWRWLWQFARRCTEKHAVAAGHALKALLDSSLAEYKALLRERPISCEWRETGLLYVMKSQAALESFAAADRFLARVFDVSARRYEGQDLRAFEPALKPGLAGAFHYPGDAMLRPDALNQRWTEDLRRRGVAFYEHRRLEGVHREGPKVASLATSQGPLAADMYVFAVGAWTPLLARDLAFRAPIEAGKGYSVTLPKPSVCPSTPMLFPEYKVGVTPFDNAFRVGSMMEFSGYDAAIPARRVAQLARAANQFLREPISHETGEAWYGWRPMTWDSLPLIGPCPGWDNAFLATGHNMLGLSLATGTGRLVAELAAGRKPHLDPAPYSPARF